jgi:hypothetical protein
VISRDPREAERSLDEEYGREERRGWREMDRGRMSGIGGEIEFGGWIRSGDRIGSGGLIESEMMAGG